MARAPLFCRRNSRASSPKSVKRGTEISPAFQAATWATAVSCRCGSKMAIRSPCCRPRATNTFARRLESAEIASKVNSRAAPEGSISISARALGYRSATSPPMLNRSGMSQRNATISPHPAPRDRGVDGRVSTKSGSPGEGPGDSLLRDGEAGVGDRLVQIGGLHLAVVVLDHDLPFCAVRRGRLDAVQLLQLGLGLRRALLAFPAADLDRLRLHGGERGGAQTQTDRDNERCRSHGPPPSEGNVEAQLSPPQVAVSNDRGLLRAACGARSTSPAATAPARRMVGMVASSATSLCRRVHGNQAACPEQMDLAQSFGTMTRDCWRAPSRGFSSVRTRSSLATARSTCRA